jgi:hypothetical protein
VDLAGNIYVAGFRDDTGGRGAIVREGQGIFLLRLDPDGVMVWERTWTGLARGHARSLALDSLGNVYLAGGVQGTATLGNTTIESEAHSRVFVARFGADGDVHWVISSSGGGNAFARSIVAQDDSAYLAGKFDGMLALGDHSVSSAGADDAFVARIEVGTGLVQWLQRLGGRGIDAAAALAVHPHNGVVVAGTFTGIVDFGRYVRNATGMHDGFVLQMDHIGQVLAATNIAAAKSMSDTPLALRVDPAGHLYVAGQLEGQWRIKDDRVVALGGRNGFLLKLIGPKVEAGENQ